MKYFLGTSIRAMTMISQEICWCSNTANSSVASKSSASVSRLSSYFSWLVVFVCTDLSNCVNSGKVSRKSPALRQIAPQSERLANQLQNI